MQFTHPRVILCEGQGDGSFFRHLIDHRNLPQFDIFWPSEPSTTHGAVQGYADMLTAFTAGNGFSNLSGILIQGDNNDNPQAKFQQIQEKIATAEGYVSPNAPFVVARANERPP